MSENKSASPFSNSDLALPTEREEVIAWARHYWRVHPFIAVWIDEIVSQVYSDFEITGKAGAKPEDVLKYQKQFMNDEGKFKYLQEACSLGIELNVVGEAFPYCELDEEKGEWASLILQNPDYIQVRRGSSGTVDISLSADDELKRLIKSKDKKDLKLVKKIPKKILSYIKAGKPIPLSPMFISHLAVKKSVSDVRGTSRLVRYFKILMHEDKLREENYNEVAAKGGGEVAPWGRELLREIRRETSTKTFEEGLKRQRKMIENWILRKILKPYGRIHDIKSPIKIKWNNQIDVGKIREVLNND